MGGSVTKEVHRRKARTQGGDGSSLAEVVSPLQGMPCASCPVGAVIGECSFLLGFINEIFPVTEVAGLGSLLWPLDSSLVRFPFICLFFSQSLVLAPVAQQTLCSLASPWLLCQR